MTQLTPHFTLEEMQKDDPIPSSLIPIFTELCETLLEPIRAEFGKELLITSGYRSPKANAEAHGQPNSEHMATTWMAACDFVVAGIGQRLVFDWCRQNPTLPFHQLILEADAQGGSVIHISLNKTLRGVRSVLTGSTHDMSAYQKCDFTPYNPPSTPAEETT